MTSNINVGILGRVSPAEPFREPADLTDGCVARVPGATWDWPQDAASLPDDAPLQALMLSATKLMGAYGQDSVRAAGLKLSLAGLGVLRILMGQDGLKAREVADRAWSSPGTLTSVVTCGSRDAGCLDNFNRAVTRSCWLDPSSFAQARG